MSTLTQAQSRQAEHGSPEKLKVAIGSAVGTTIENYDFLAYGTAAALYFGSAFFPGQDPLAATLLAFATLAWDLRCGRWAGSSAATSGTSTAANRSSSVRSWSWAAPPS
jgi:hypothetical protein